MDVTTPSDWPGSFDDFRRTRTRFLDRLAVEALLRRIEREAVSAPPARDDAATADPTAAAAPAEPRS